MKYHVMLDRYNGTWLYQVLFTAIFHWHYLVSYAKSLFFVKKIIQNYYCYSSSMNQYHNTPAPSLSPTGQYWPSSGPLCPGSMTSSVAQGPPCLYCGVWQLLLNLLSSDSSNILTATKLDSLIGTALMVTLETLSPTWRTAMDMDRTQGCWARRYY